jgi:hypothetical protein
MTAAQRKTSKAKPQATRPAAGPGVRTVKAEAARVRRALAAMARDPGTFDARRYFRGDVDLKFYNVGTGPVRALATELYRARKNRWPLETALAFADVVIRDPYLEVKGAGIEFLARYRPEFVPSMLPTLKDWLERNDSSNWATTDALCGYVIGHLLARYPRFIRGVASWSRHANMWVRRAAAVSLIVPMRKGLALDELYEVAARLHRDHEDLIQKAVGWALREAGKQDEARLEGYLRAHGSTIPRTTLRYAIERMAPGKRSELMTSTRTNRVR